jgi:competence protein ComGC
MRELFQFLWSKKKFWLIPVIIVLLLIGFLIVFAGSSALSPFIYTLF